MTTTLTTAAHACPKCGSTDTKIQEQTFRDGTQHLRESCCSCDSFIRYAPRHQARQSLPLAASPGPAPALPTPTPAGNATLTRAIEALDSVRERSAELREELKGKQPDQAEAAALFGAALAASANLSVENLDSLKQAIRAGQLPRRKTG